MTFYCKVKECDNSSWSKPFKNDLCDSCWEKERENKDYLVILNRYEIYPDGVIYDRQAKSLADSKIPQWIFDFRDFVLNNYENMK